MHLSPLLFAQVTDWVKKRSPVTRESGVNHEENIKLGYDEVRIRI